jgi:hypothetical protein
MQTQMQLPNGMALCQKATNATKFISAQFQNKCATGSITGNQSKQLVFNIK